MVMSVQVMGTDCIESDWFGDIWSVCLDSQNFCSHQKVIGDEVSMKITAKTTGKSISMLSTIILYQPLQFLRVILMILASLKNSGEKQSWSGNALPHCITQNKYLLVKTGKHRSHSFSLTTTKCEMTWCGVQCRSRFTHWLAPLSSVTSTSLQVQLVCHHIMLTTVFMVMQNFVFIYFPLANRKVLHVF